MSSNNESLAIVGAGVAGLTAARTLAQAGVAVAVFDKGQGVGGRTSTCHDESGRQFDHGAQYFTATSAAFQKQIEAWVVFGVAALWEGRLATLVCDSGGTRLDAAPAAKRRYVGVPGMNALTRQLAEEAASAGATIVSGVEVTPLKRGGDGWRLVSASGDSLGAFDRVLVTTPAPQAAELLTPSPALANAAKSVRTSGCWALMAAFAEPVAADFDGAFVNGSASTTPLSWIARDNSKPGRQLLREDLWVLHGSPAWSQGQLDQNPADITQPLLAGFWRALGLPPQEPLGALPHRWRYALPENPLPEAAPADRELGLYAAGDWCGGPRVEGAYLSGLAAAQAILADR